MAGLRDASRLIAPAVAETVAALTTSPEDAAAIRLAETYARMLDASDDPDILAAIGPKLLAVLESLGATPRARAGLARTQTGPVPGASALELLRGGA